MDYPKQKIRINFSEAVSYYHEHAAHQASVAKRLANALEPWQYSVPEGPVLEFGAGTGFFTEFLINMFTNRALIVSDLSEEMVEYCRSKFDRGGQIQFEKLDAEKYDWPENKYALIAGNYVVQWFKHPAQTVSNIARALKPGGLLLVSFPASESFSNWKQYCVDLGIPFTGNTLPDLERVVIDLSMGPFQVDYYEDDLFDAFENVYDFFRHLKKTGTSTNLNQKNLSMKQLKLLNDYWLEKDQGKISVQYHTAFVAAKRDLE